MNYLIDPDRITNFKRTEPELQLFWLFCIVVAGKTAKTQALALERFLNNIPGDTPFDKIAYAWTHGTLRRRLESARLGQYARLEAAFAGSLRLNLKTCAIKDLEAIQGIGPKTSRFFVMHSRRNQRVAALDTHILKHLRAEGVEAPKTTPSASKRYRELEEKFLALVDKSGMSVADYDLQVWKSYANGR